MLVMRWLCRGSASESGACAQIFTVIIGIKRGWPFREHAERLA